MANIENSNNFFVKPPKFSWLDFSYSQESLKEVKLSKNAKKQQGNESKLNELKVFKEPEIESRSQSFIELSKLLTDDCQYGILDEFAGTKEEREEIKKQKEMRKLKREEEKKANEEIEEKIRNEYVVLDDIPLDDDNQDNEMNENNDESENKSKKVTLSSSVPIEKINTSNLGKKNATNYPFSAPVISNNDKPYNFKELEKFNRRSSLDHNIIHIYGSSSYSTENIIKPLNDVSILSNNYFTSIEIKTPIVREDDSSFLKSFLNGNINTSHNSTKKSNQKEYNNNIPNADESLGYNKYTEKFKTMESNNTLNVVFEKTNLKYDGNESYDELPKNLSLESLESVEFDNKEKKLSSNNSWISSISKSFQSWMNQRDEIDYEKLFTKTDKDGNIQILSVNSIMELYSVDVTQALNIHDYMIKMVPKFPKHITSYTKHIAKINQKLPVVETKTLELIYKNRSANPIIISDLALKIRKELPQYLQTRCQWTMQFSLNSVTSKGNHESLGKESNLRKLIHSEKYHGPCLIIIQDDNNYIFGAYIHEQLHDDNNPYGSKECFLWKYQNSALEVFRPIEDTNDLIISNSEFLSVGGSTDGQYALYLDKDLRSGHSYYNRLFKNKCLSAFGDFYISELELWTFDYD
ncbi:TLD-domain-containing protein [Anaeromyces robustus]|uniref:Oxidation resistance protein 1 n=1 Tax=Anaeromyces robustus TaxID=1754192 RepID=A0A1Y1XL08_9FUNG|nr:TLD-domain-containing protein [Anaeromyces robustus]|eukprot:ORX86447.1 TLD-domain-containing protein [Anaeromyces robustus]